MQTSVTFRHMNASDPLRNHALEKVSRFGKYFDETADAHIVLSTEKYLHRAEINIQAHGMNMHGKELSGDMYNSIDRAMDKVERQVKKYKSRITKHRPKEGSKLKMRFKLLEAAGIDKTGNATDLPPTIIETSEFQARPMMIDEAVMQMDLLNNDILVFLNTKTDQVNVLYRKQNNKYGLIEATSTN